MRIRLYVTGAALTSRLRERAYQRGRERGSITLETVLIAVGLFAVATLLVVAITAAVKGRLNGIQ